MHTRRLGSSDLLVSVVGLGCNNFGSRTDEATSRAVVDAALAAGITFFDTAESYGGGDSERFLGRSLVGYRDQVVIATKFGGRREGSTPPPGSRDYIRAAIAGSLGRLGTDYVDLYQYHRPDGVTPIEETLGAMDELVQAGKVRFVGSSNLTASQVVEAEEASAPRGLSRFVTAQNRYSVLDRAVERDLVPVCERLGIGVVPYYPLENGLLTGKYRRGEPAPQGTRLSGRLDVSDEQWARIEALEAFGRERGRSLLEVAIAGLASEPVVASVIAGATKPEQVRANAAAADWELSAEELEALRGL